MESVFKCDEENVKEEVKECGENLERHYLPVTNFRLDWNKLLCNVDDEDNFRLDWNKLVYNEEQCLEFAEEKYRRVFRNELFDYLLKPFDERTAEEKHFIKDAGFCIYEGEVQGEELYSSAPIGLGDQDMTEVLDLKSRDILYNV